MNQSGSYWHLDKPRHGVQKGVSALGKGYKPICRDCAMYFSISVYTPSLLHKFEEDSMVSFFTQPQRFSRGMKCKRRRVPSGRMFGQPFPPRNCRGPLLILNNPLIMSLNNHCPLIIPLIILNNPY